PDGRTGRRRRRRRLLRGARLAGLAGDLQAAHPQVRGERQGRPVPGHRPRHARGREEGPGPAGGDRGRRPQRPRPGGRVRSPSRGPSRGGGEGPRLQARTVGKEVIMRWQRRGLVVVLVLLAAVPFGVADKPTADEKKADEPKEKKEKDQQVVKSKASK